MRPQVAPRAPDQATSWNPGPDGSITTIEPAGGTILVTGYFEHVGGAGRNYVAALSAKTGTATGWNPAPDGEVAALAVGPSAVYAGGDFGAIGGQLQPYFAALDRKTGAALQHGGV